MGRVQDKVVFITGGASGIGKASAEWLVREGANVAIADLNDEGGQAVADSLGDAGFFLHHDVTNEANWAPNLKAARDHFGRLDAVANSAGIVIPGDPVDTPLENWQKVFRINVEGTFLCNKYAVPLLAEGGGGVIINFGSIASYDASAGLVAYCASKAAVRSLMRSTALYCKEQENKVRVNAVFPGPILTPMTNNVLDGALGEGAHEQFKPGEASPFGVLGEADDIAGAVVYLISDDAKYANATELMLDGGTRL